MAFLIPENLRSRPGVPPAVSMLARVLSDHLPFGATVWWEPLFTVDDDKPDLVVLVPDTGVLVLEVLQTKRSAVLSVEGSRLRVKGDAGPKVIEHPLAKAQRFAAAVEDRLREVGIGEDDRLPVLAAGVVAYIDRRTADEQGLSQVVETGKCLFRDDLDDMNESPDAARRVLAGLLHAPLRDGPISEQAERLYRAVIHPDTVLTPVQGELPGVSPALTADVKALDREQEALAKTIGAGHRVIRGVAGSGKTVILIHRARLLAQLNGSARILVTCYNRSLAGYLKRQLNAFPNVTVATLSAVMSRAMAKAGAAPPDFQKESDVEVAERALSALATLDPADDNLMAGLQFDHVLIDEAQDFAAEALCFGVSLLAPGADSLLVVADAAQSIYGKGFTWKDACIDAVGRTKVLRRNYRNTRPILDFAWSFLSREIDFGVTVDSGDEGDSMSDLVVPPETSDRPGRMPLFQVVSSRDAEVLTIADQVGTGWPKTCCLATSPSSTGRGSPAVEGSTGSTRSPLRSTLPKSRGTGRPIRGSGSARRRSDRSGTRC